MGTIYGSKFTFLMNKEQLFGTACFTEICICEVKVVFAWVTLGTLNIGLKFRLITIFPIVTV